MTAMPGTIAAVLQALLDRSGALGVGLVDRQGLLLESCGAHDGQRPEAIAALLCHPPFELAALLEDVVSEQVWIGQRYSFYLRYLSSHRLYAMSWARAAGGPIRQQLQRAAQALGGALEPSLGAPARQRLEQPRQFGDSRRIG